MHKSPGHASDPDVRRVLKIVILPLIPRADLEQAKAAEQADERAPAQHPRSQKMRKQP
jgi:hypothetical protein